MDQSKTNNMPEEVQRAMGSSELAEKLLVIGKVYGLTIDQVGRLETLVAAVMNGSLHPNDFVGELEGALGLDDDAVTSIASDVNLEIFLPIRQALMGMHREGEGQATAPQAADESQPSRDSILEGIENPVPAVHPFSLADTMAGGAAKPLEIRDERAQAQTSQDVAQGFIAGKLSETMATPGQKTETTPEALAAKPPEKPKGYSVDPYREPLI